MPNASIVDLKASMTTTAPMSKVFGGKDYLAEFDAAAESEKFPLVKRWMELEPLPFFDQLRRQRPVLVTPECTLLALFTDIRDALQMPKIFTVDLYKPKMGVTTNDPGFMMAHDDNALHDRERAIMKGMLNRDDIPEIRLLIERVSRRLLKKAEGELDIVNHYGRIVPAVLVREYFGLDGIDTKKILKWSYWSQYNAFHNQPFNLHSPEKFKHIETEQAKCVEEMVSYIKILLIRKLIAVKTTGRIRELPLMLSNSLRRLTGKVPKKLKDDIVTRMLRTSFPDNVDFPLDRMGANVGGLLVGTIETTSQAVTQVIQFFIDRPELMEQAKLAAAQQNADKFDGMVWEALRFVPISPYLFRQASEDYIIASGTDRQTTIPEGTNVLMLTQSAMFDEYSYPEPDQFNAQRNWYHHFNFGFASHDCIGKYIGMVMIPEMVRQVLLLDSLRAVSKMDYKDGPFPESYHLAWKG